MYETFETAMTDWVRVAHELQLECDSEETRQSLVKNMMAMHNFIQQKQDKFEESKKVEIVAELEEVDALKDRIGHLRSKKGVTSRDVLHEDFVIIYREIKMTVWQDLFEALIADTDDSIEIILQRLNGILKLCADRCEREMSARLHDTLFTGLYPGENLHRVGAPKVPAYPDQELLEHTTYLLDKSAPLCMPFIQTAICESLLAEKKTDTVRLLQAQTPRLKDAIRAYLHKCIEFGWVAALQTPSIHIITDPKNQCVKLKGSFLGVEDVPHTLYVEWPALIQNDEIKLPWQLYYHVGQARPVARQPEKVEYNTKQVRVEEEEDNIDWEIDVGVMHLGQARKEIGLLVEGATAEKGEDNYEDSKSLDQFQPARKTVSRQSTPIRSEVKTPNGRNEYRNGKVMTDVNVKRKAKNNITF